MSFVYNGRVITLDNYKEVFGTCMPDILDEIRSAVLDDTPIASFINVCGDDSYKLGQFRMALREITPVEYLNKNFSGKTIYYIRRCFKEGVDASPLLRYVRNRSLLLPVRTIEMLAEFAYGGVDIDRVDFTKVPFNLVPVFARGLSRGFPMWLFITDKGVPFSEEYIETLMKGLSIGVDIHPFLEDTWDIYKLSFLFSHSKQINLNDLLRQINQNFDTDCLRVLIDLMKDNVPISQLCVREEGYPVYNSYQMEVLGSAIRDNTITPNMFNPNLSDMEMDEMHQNLLSNRN